MLFNENDVIKVYERSFEEAKDALRGLEVAQKRSFSGTGLSGWIFEQTIRTCLDKELSARDVKCEMEEQVALLGRAKIDLRVGRVAIEIKARGSFGRGDGKYEDYGRAVIKRGWDYVYISMQETHGPFKAETMRVFGEGRAFFLDVAGDWARFVDAVVDLQVVRERV